MPLNPKPPGRHPLPTTPPCPPRPVMPAPICTWVYDGDYSKWDTDCGEAFELSNDATLCDNKIQFCPFCGKRINEVA